MISKLLVFIKLIYIDNCSMGMNSHFFICLNLSITCAKIIINRMINYKSRQ